MNSFPFGHLMFSGLLELKWSAILHKNQYVVLRGTLKYFKWSAFQKSLGTNGLGYDKEMNTKKVYHLI